MSTPKGETLMAPERLARLRADIEAERRPEDVLMSFVELLADRDSLAEALSRVTEEVEGLRKRVRVAKGKAAKYRGTTTEVRCCGMAQAYEHAAEIIGDAL